MVTASLFVNCVIAIALSLSGTQRRELKVAQEYEPDILRFLKRTLSVTRNDDIVFILKSIIQDRRSFLTLILRRAFSRALYLGKRFCKIFSESSTAVMQLPCCPGKHSLVYKTSYQSSSPY